MSKRNEFGQRIARGTLILSVDASMTASEIKLVGIPRVAARGSSFGWCVSATRCTSG